MRMRAVKNRGVTHVLNSACVIEVRTLDVEKEPADLLEQVGRLAEEIRERRDAEGGLAERSPLRRAPRKGARGSAR